MSGRVTTFAAHIPLCTHLCVHDAVDPVAFLVATVTRPIEAMDAGAKLRKRFDSFDTTDAHHTELLRVWAIQNPRCVLAAPIRFWASLFPRDHIY